ncbi:MAG TPA: hypothetical protein VIC35_13850 [Acidimicrobiia bacterium]|jgi:hypothetical protein
MRRFLRPFVVLAVCSLAGAVLVVQAPAASATPINRPSDPVVITGATTPTLQGQVPTQIVGFRADGSGWVQIPIQVDERAMLDLGLVYHGAANGVKVLAYTSNATFAGADPNKKFDADDELAFMARDTGVQATAASAPVGTVSGTGVAVHVTDPLAPGADGYVYLFVKAKGSKLQQGAGKKYVKYQFHLDSGNYKKTYKTTAGPNPENTHITGATYTQHFGDRWLTDSITVTAPGATKVDILDRAKPLFAPGNCVRTEDTFDSGEGAFIVNKSGPVRAIRSYIGANSGPNTERTNIFYDRREDVVTDLRVHAIPSIMDLMDYSPAATGMTYRNELNPTGVTVDGNPDSLTAGVSSWEQITGVQGTLTSVGQLTTSFATPGLTSYYLDDSTPPVTQCTGDAFAYGESGLYLNSALPCTDPGMGCSDTLRGVRTMYFDPPGGTVATAATERDDAVDPLAATAAAWSP